MSRAWPRCSATGWSRCTRTSTAGCSPTSTTPSTSPTSSGMASHRSASSCRTSIRSSSVPTSRRSTSAAPRWSAPRRRTTRTSPSSSIPRTTSWCSKSSAARVRSRRRPRRARPEGVRAHVRVRRGDLRMARRQRRGAAGDAVTRRSIGCRSCVTARTRTKSARVTASAVLESWWDHAVQHGGKELSYLNLFDAEAAWRLVHQLGDRPAAVVVKHANPCGVAVADDISDGVYRGARVRSGVGVRRHRRVEPSRSRLARARARSGVHRGRRRTFVQRRRARDARPRRRTCACSQPDRRARAASTSDRSTAGCWCSPPTRVNLDRAAWRVVTKVAPTEDQWRDLELAWMVCAAVSSNAIVLVGNERGRRHRRWAAEPRRLGPHRGRRELTAAREAGRARATPTSPSATASTRRPRRASRR